MADAELTRAEIAAAAQELADAHIDSNSMLLEEGPGFREVLHYDDAEDEFHVERIEDVESVLEWCKGRYNEGLVNQHCEFRHVGSYPQNVLEIFAQKQGIPPGKIVGLLGKDDKLTKRLLEDRDLSGFRTLAGRI